MDNSQNLTTQSEANKYQFREFMLSGVTCYYLIEEGRSVRQKPSVSWEAFHTANMITDAEYDKIIKYAKFSVGHQPIERCIEDAALARGIDVLSLGQSVNGSSTSSSADNNSGNNQAVVPEIEEYFTLLISFMQKIVRVDTLQQLLVHMDDVLYGAAISPALVHRLSQLSSASTLFSLLLKLMLKDDTFVQLQSCKLFADLLSLWPKSVAELKLTEFLRWNMSQVRQFLQSGASGYGSNLKISSQIDVYLQSLAAVLRQSKNRKFFWDMTKGGDVLAELLQRSAPGGSKEDSQFKNPQLQYQVIVCIWLLTLNQSIAVQFQTQYNIIPTLVDITRSSIKEKVVRVCLSVMRNMLSFAMSQSSSGKIITDGQLGGVDIDGVGAGSGEDKLTNRKVHDAPAQTGIISAFVGTKSATMVDNLLSRKWSDEDIVTDLKWFKEQLSIVISSLTAWDEYISELRSQRLDWSPVHDSEKLWKQNAYKLLDNNAELLKLLVSCLQQSTESVRLAVACHDVAKFLKYCAKQGKKQLQSLGAKERIMELMSNSDSEVRYYALMATQQYMQSVLE
ncbi:hypothetical protein MP228_011612 [Amoeboaphelidium protococcarum]|nr:hypothetical protein MP228_011612 [Amoeboaphelidium protococcarum]